MKIRLSKLKGIIREAAEDPQALFDEMQALLKKYGTEWSMLGKGRWRGYVNEADYEELLALRDEYAGMKMPETIPVDEFGEPLGEYEDPYVQFFFAVGPGNYDRRKDRYEKTNKFSIPHANVIRALFDGQIGAPLDEVNQAWDRYSELQDMFEYTSGTTQTDRVYGRNRTNVVFKPTGEVISSKTDRQGSLGT